MRIPLVAILLAGGAIGLMMPMGDESGETIETAASSASAPELQLGQATRQPTGNSVPGWSEEVVLEREFDGHFYANVSVDGYDYRMLVDTGASVVALTAEDATAMGLTWFDEDVAPIARGAGGPVSGVDATINRMQLGQIEASNVRAVILPEHSGISLLGQSFLSTVGRVEISGDRMVLGG